MFNPRHLSRQLPRRQQKAEGFALVIAITLVAFLLLLMLGVSTLVQVEVRSADASAQEARARQNALFGAFEALGRIQSATGQDQRVTARAEILDTNPDTQAIDGVNEPFWTGVWISDPSDPRIGGDTYDNLRPVKEGLAGSPGGALAWLVSSQDPDPLTHSRDTGSDIPLLRVDAANPADPRNIYVPAVELEAPDASGNYAWWVADEGVKATIGLDNEWARSSDTIESRVSQLTALRMAPEFIQYLDPTMDLRALAGAGSTEAAYDSLLARAVTLGETEILLNQGGSTAPEVRQVVRNHLHNLTPMAQSVLVDVREGGLKRNLSAAFSSQTGFNQLLSDHGGQLLFGPTDAQFSPVDSTGSRGNSGNQAERRDPGGPPWAQLRSFYNLRRSGNTPVTVQPQTNDQMGVHPIITHFQVHFHTILLEHPDSTQDEPRFVVRLLTIPAVVLWNPYTVPLQSTDYSLFYARTLTGTANRLDYKWAVDITAEIEGTGSENEFYRFSDSFSDSESVARRTFGGFEQGGPIRLNLTASFQPGETKLFIPAGASEQNFGTDTAAGNQLMEAGSFSHLGYIYSELDEHFTPGAKIVGDIVVEQLFRPEGTVAERNGIGNLTVEMGFDGNFNEMVSNGPLHSTGGFNHFGSGIIGNLSWSIPFDAVFPPYADGNEDEDGEPVDDLIDDFPVALGSEGFPITGVSYHFHMLQNEHPVNSQNQSLVGRLASYNPRAVRSNRSPVEHRARPLFDRHFNPMYLYSAEFMGGSGSSNYATTSWGTLFDGWLGTGVVPIGPSDSTTSSITRNTLFDLPTGPEYFQSIAALQHASVAPPMPRTNSPNQYLTYGAGQTSDWNVNNHYPAYPIGNSTTPLALPLDRKSRNTWIASNGLNNDPQSALYDMSYLLNDQLWDRYFFAEYDASSERMYNPRMAVEENADPASLESYADAAGNLMVLGSFNVNSTSVDAWRALLAGLVGVTVDPASGGSTEYDDRSPYLRSLNPHEGNADGQGAFGPNVYGGYRTLDADEIESLAEAIVTQVKKRGPFISMSHFVNRVIQNDDFRSTREAGNLSGRERAIGALQAALEASTVNAGFDEPLYSFTAVQLQPRFEQFEPLTGEGPVAFGQPGYVTQGDLLSRIGSVLTPRSDTFKIRSYGDDINPITGETNARVWCEMTVQRVPQELDDSPNDRGYRIVSFRWLGTDEI